MPTRDGHKGMGDNESEASGPWLFLPYTVWKIVVTEMRSVHSVLRQVIKLVRSRQIGGLTVPAIVTPTGYCATKLQATNEFSEGSVGVVALLTSPDFGADTIAVTMGFLPNPLKIGYEGFAFLVVDPNDGFVVKRQQMTAVDSGEGTWSGTVSNDTDQGGLPKGLIMVFVSRSNGDLGIEVASGNLALCKG